MLKRRATRERAERKVEAAVERVRNDPCGSHSLTETAAELNMAPERFHRVFRTLFGAPFGDFVRRARMDRAVALMRSHPDTLLTEIALECGFADSSEFSRTFKRRFGIAPSSWNRIAPLNLVKKSQADTAEDIVASALFPEDGPSDAEGVHIRTFPAVRYASLRIEKPHINANLVAGFNRLEQWLAGSGQLREGRYFVGMSHESPMDTLVSEWRFQLSYPVDASVLASDDVGIMELPKMCAATKDCAGDVTSFVEAWDTLKRRWLPRSGYVIAEHPAMEIYYDDPRPHNLAYWEIGCVLPIRKQTDGGDDG